MKESKNLIIFYIIAVLSLACEFFQLSVIVGDFSPVKQRVILYIADAMLLTFFYWFCSGKWRCITLVWIWFISLFVLANVMYFRYWGDMIPLMSVFETSNYNSFVFNSIVPLFKLGDLSFICLPVVATVAYKLLHVSDAECVKIADSFMLTMIIVAFYVLTYCLSLNGLRKWQKEIDMPVFTMSEIFQNRMDRNSTQIDIWISNGFTAYMVNQIINYPDRNAIELDAADRKSLQDLIDSKLISDNDSIILADNNGKNLIFIIVESLNAWTIGKTYNGHELMPNLTALLESEGTVSCLKVAAQINDGGSSDGQLIYNTGLLPLLSGVAAQIYGTNDYPSLCKVLKPKSSAEFIVENANVYNHRQTSKSFGYDMLYDESALKTSNYDKSEIGGDEAVLGFAFDEILKMEQPFVAEITTLSMHYPFFIEGFEPQDWIDSLNIDNDYLKNYLQTVHYTDAAIGRFIGQIKESKLADNTVIVIASDHDEGVEKRQSENAAVESDIVFIATGTGITKTVDFPIGQVDVFPTVLDIMGAGAGSWRGLGESALRNHPRAAISRQGHLKGEVDEQKESRLRRISSASDSLIRSDYWAGN